MLAHCIRLVRFDLIRFAGRIVSLAALGLICTGTAGPAAAAELVQQDIFSMQQDGYNAYRFPSLVVSNSGTLLAFAAGKSGVSDYAPGDLVLKRSFDNGRTWQGLQIALRTADAGWSIVGNANPVVDRQTGAIIVPVAMYADSTEPAYDPPGGVQHNVPDRVYVVRSLDDGATWSAPVEITSSVKDSSAHWSYYALGAGHSIQLSENSSHPGRIIVPAVHRYYSYSLSNPSVTNVFYSDDHGQTWQLGGSLPDGSWTNESSLVELLDGSLYMSVRDRDTSRVGSDAMHHRWSSSSDDGGMTWTSPEMDHELIEYPFGTAGSVARYTGASPDARSRLLLSHQQASQDRLNLSVHSSYDEGTSWTSGKSIYHGHAAYSDLATTTDGTINVLYERGLHGDAANQSTYQRISLAQFDLAWLESSRPAYVRFDFNEQSAGLAPATAGYLRDSSGTEMPGQAVNQPQYVGGSPLLGNTSALRFSAGGDHVQIFSGDGPAFWSLAAGDGFTLETVVKSSAHQTGGFDAAGTLASYASSVTQAGWFLQMEEGGLRFRMTDALGASADLTTQLPASDGQWHHVAVVRDPDADQVALYLDHVLAGTIADPTTASVMDRGDVLLGQWTQSNLRPFEGEMDAFRFTRGVLGAGELLGVVPEPGSIALMAIGAGVLACWRLRRGRRAAE